MLVTNPEPAGTGGELRDVSRMSQVSARPGHSYAFIVKFLPGIQAVLDSIVLIAVGLFTYHSLVFYSYKTVELYYAAICFSWLLNILLFQFAGLYSFDAIFSPRRIVDRLLIAVVVTFLLMMAAAFSLKISDQFSRLWFFSLFGATSLGVIAIRFSTASLTAVLSNHGIIVRRLALYGKLEQLGPFIRYLEKSEPHVARITSIFLEKGQDPNSAAALGYPIGGDLTALVSHIRSDAVDDVVVAIPWSDAERIRSVVETLRELPTNVLLSGDVASFALPMAPAPSYYETNRVAQLVGKPLSGFDVVAKTAMDYLVAVTLLIVLTPLFCVVSILIKLDSPGPILFKQKRLGFNNRVFYIYKFRSMANVTQTETKTIQAVEGDPRITRLGRFLRRSSIDELPQLLNVLNGSMSIVGPRPHAVDHNEDYGRKIRGYFARHRTKPGITGLAQVKGYRGPTDTDEKMEMRVKHDIEYIENWSLGLDIKILLMTVAAVLFPKNAC